MPAHRKPSALKLLHGNPGKRPLDLSKEIQVAPLDPKPPEWLSVVAKREWRRLYKHLAQTKMLFATDQSFLAMYATAYAHALDAEDILRREGQIVREPIVTRSGNLTGKERIKAHPAVVIAKDARAQMVAIGRLFGLSPVSRSLVQLPPAEDEEPEVDLNEDDGL